MLNALIAAAKNTTDKTTEIINGIRNSAMEISPEIRSTFREVRTTGLKADNGFTTLKTENRAIQDFFSSYRVKGAGRLIANQQFRISQ